jgi:uncharacterized protein YyaL (SSP411 family)
MSNRLVHESSPYLLQHAHNPVDWFAWGDAAFEKARNDDRPVFLSIGYAACHWCHVMERESFENHQIAAFLNQHFVSIKVDREERPDVDQVYMQAVMAIRGGQGGWPLSAFLTPDAQVFFGGTYWPPESRMGMPGFDHVLKRVLHAFQHQREQIAQQSQEVTGWLIRQQGNSTAETEIPRDVLRHSIEKLTQSFDFHWGGFGGAPKFPHSMHLDFLLRQWRAPSADLSADRDRLLKMVRLNLVRMADGGIYDHLAGGFSRYSVDEQWLVPHFEKMLYDNALLIPVYLSFYQVSMERRIAEVARETLDYLLTDMRDVAGGFHSAEDADSEGEEGRFYVWSQSEIQSALGEVVAPLFCSVLGVSATGNFEGQNILHLPLSIEEFSAANGLDQHDIESQIKQAKSKLLAIRNQRVRPGKDDKVLVNWNALAISAFARGAIVLGDDRYRCAANEVWQFIQTKMFDGQGRLLHTFRAGSAKQPGFLDDYSYLIVALLDLYEVEFDESLVVHAVRLAENMLQIFGDPTGGALFYTGNDQPALIARLKDQHDSSIPSGNAMAACGLIRLARLTGRTEWAERAREIVAATTELMQRSPLAVGQMLIANTMLLEQPVEYVLLAPDEQSADEALRIIRLIWRPDAVLACRVESRSQPFIKELESLFAGRKSIDNQPTLYVCRDHVCDKPAVGLTEIERAMSAGINTQSP